VIQVDIVSGVDPERNRAVQPGSHNNREPGPDLALPIG
jgi:hypothetical protein